jgi:outer membrane receptor protein involved in Fe transport
MRSSWGVAAACALSAVASPAEAQQIHRIETPPGSLQQAVIALGKQARISIAIVDPSLGRIRVARVSGRMTAEQALRRMLAGSQASFVALGGSSYRIVRASAAQPRRRPLPERRRPVPPEPRPEQPLEIVVTASKRNVPLRNYPGPATVVPGDAFAGGSAASGTEAISERVPSLGSTHLGPGRDKLFIRSIADSSFTGQTQSTVGQYFDEARVNYNAPDPDLRLYDIASVEILPGPQGTLYGAGAMGGVLRIIPNGPQLGSTNGSVIASVAATQHGGFSRELAAVANLPISSEGAVRLVGYDLSEAGYIDDIGRAKEDVNRTRISGGRALAKVELGGGWSTEAGAVYQRIDGRDGQYADRALRDLTRMTFFAQPFSNDYALGYLTLRGTIGELQLIATVSGAAHDLVEDFDATLQDSGPTLFRQRNKPSLLSTETRISRSRPDGSGWLVGAQLLRNRSRLDRWSGPPDELEPLLGVRNSIDEQTVFGEYSYRPTDRISLTGGLRLSHVTFSGRAIGSTTLQVDGPSSAGGSDLRLLPSLAAGLDAGRDVAIYLRYQESFRPGGLIVRSNAAQELESDHIAAWETGLRFGQRPGSTFGGALAVSFARWTDIQADTIDTTGLPSTINIGDGNIYSFEGRAEWRPTRDLAFSLAATVNRSRVNNPNPGVIMVLNAPLPNVPDVVGRFGADYRHGIGRFGDVRLSAWANYVGKSWLGVGPILGREQGEFLNTGLEARVGRADRYLFLRATNLLDSAGNRFALGNVFSIVFEDHITPLRPRTLRVGVHTAF